MGEIITLVTAVGGLVTLAIFYFREVRKRADLEKELVKLDGVMQSNKAFALEIVKLNDAIDRAEDYIDELEQKIVDQLEPADLADAINRVFARRSYGSAAGND